MNMFFQTIVSVFDFQPKIVNIISNKSWLIFSNIISISLISLFLILLGIIFPNKAKLIKFLNLISAFYLIIFFYLTTLEYSYTFFDVNLAFNQNISLFVNLFIYIATLTTLIFFIGISNVYYLEENMKIEYTLLVFYIYISAVFLISSFDFISIIILLECIAFSSYVLVGFERKNKFSTSSALRYLILATIPGGFFILGVSILYHNYGSFYYEYLDLLIKSLSTNTLNNIQIDEIFKYYILKTGDFNQDIRDYLMNLQEEHLMLPDGTLFEYATVLDKWSSDNIHIAYDKRLFKASILRFSELTQQEIEFTMGINFDNKDTFLNWKEQALNSLKDLYKGVYMEYVAFYKYYNYYIGSFNIKNFSVFVIQYFNDPTYMYAEGAFLDNWFLNFFENGLTHGKLTFPFLNHYLMNDLALDAIKINNLEIPKKISLGVQYGEVNLYDYFFPGDNAANYFTLLDSTGEIGKYSIYITELVHLKNFNNASRYNFTNFDFIHYDRRLNVYMADLNYWLNALYEGFLAFHSVWELYIRKVVEEYIIANPLHELFSNKEKNLNEMATYINSGVSPRDIGLWLLLRAEEIVPKFYGKFYLSSNETFLTGLFYLPKFFENPTVFGDNYFYTNIFLSTYIVLLCIIMNLAFKITAAPFHSWAPTVYGGSPLPTITFLSIFSKLTIVSFTIVLFFKVFENLQAIWQMIFFLMGVFSIIVSILGAFTEKLFKRFFVYSSVGHIGYIISGIATLNIIGISSAIDYLIVYAISSLIIWFIVMHLTKKTTHLINLKGLSFNYPALSFIFVLTLFSLSGLPPMGGFFVKFEVFYSILNSSWYFIAYILLLLTVVSFFYYLRLVKIIYFENNKIFYKNNKLEDLKLRVISILIFILPMYMVFVQYPLIYIIKQIIKSSF